MNTPPVIRLSNAIADMIGSDNLGRLDDAELEEVAELLGMGLDAIRRRRRILEHGLRPISLERDPPIITEAELRLLDGNR